MSTIERAAAVLLVGAMLSVVESRPAAGQSAPAAVHALLDVPYLSQTPELCGGAAVAMVLRYWGGRDVFPQDFASLVTASDGGILTSTLASAVRARGSQALVLPMDAGTAHARIQMEIDQGRPLIALIEAGSHIYHYVVIVGSTDQEVVLHDPARAPFRVLPWAEFDRAWAGTGRWIMVVLPLNGLQPDTGVVPTAPATTDVSVDATAVEETPCAALVDRAVHMALAGDLDGAEEGLVAATRLCPQEAASWRELAGLRFSQSRWLDARDLALDAVRLAPDDAYARQLLATTRYLTGDVMGALDTWNHVGNPRIDTIAIQGVKHTRQPVVVRATGLEPRQMLTPEAFARALRHLRDLPTAANAQMRYEPISSGSAEGNGELVNVDVFIDERPVVPSGWLTFATFGARGLLYDELEVDVAGPLGVGDVESASWRWSAARPRAAFDLAVPSTEWLPGVVSLDVSWERQTYESTATPDDAALVEGRRRAGLRVADWATSWLRWQTGAALDRLREYDGLDDTSFAARDYLAVDASIDLRVFRDRVALGATGGWWTPFAGGDQFGTGDVFAAWRSTIDPSSPSWSAMTEIDVASRVAPLALWPGAGTGQGRSGLLRAHPLLNDDVVTGPIFGREVFNSSFEYSRPVGHTLAGGLAVAGFIDTAEARQRLNGLNASPLYVDVGVGLRVHAPGAGGAVRIDVAHGLRGGGTVLSAGWGVAWPK